MTPQELKSSILQLAVQGKLVEQRAEEGTAEELLHNTTIQGKISGRKVKQKDVTEIDSNDLPFDIPDNWVWVKLGTVCTIARGGSPRPIKEYITNESDGVNWIKIGDTEKDGKYIISTKEKIKPSGVSKSRMVHSGDFLLTNSMSFGRPYILKTDGCIHDGWLVISQQTEVFFQDYLYWLLSSRYAYNQFCGKVSGAVVKNLNSDKVANSVFPLPPTAEQKRIVAKIEELLPYVDRYEKAWSKLEDFNKRFPTDMQKSVLQMAIQGKLVKQRPEEGTGEELYRQIQAEKQRLIKEGKIKKEKPLPEITEDEIPFDIPESWKWVKLGNIVSVYGGKRIPAGRKLTEVNTGHIYIRVSDMKNGSVNTDNLLYVPNDIYDSISRYIINKEDIYITVAGTIGRVGKIPTELDGANLTENADRLVFTEIHQDWLIQALDSPLIKEQISEATTKVGQPKLAIKRIQKLQIPLPPLAEQKRIVQKLEEILPLCEKLK